MSQSNKQPRFARFKIWAKRLIQKLKALKVALSENLVPWYVKALIIAAIAYAFSPIDLIPDFIPVLGLLDDLIIVPLLIYVIVKFIPTEVMEYCRRTAEKQELYEKKNWFVGSLIIFIWLALGIWLLLVLTR